MRSEWPPEYFERDDKTISPSGGWLGEERISGVKKKEERNVVSMTINGRVAGGREWTMREIRGRGGTRRRGLVGTSSQIS